MLCRPVAAQTWQSVTVGTTTRKMLTYVPKQLPESPALVISLHGYGQSPEYQMNQTKWNELADTAHIVVVYPQGNNNAWDISGTSDTKFIEQIMKKMQKTYHVDKNRIYISGFSMGGMMTYHCMAKLGNTIAAFGPVSGIPVDYRDPVAPRHVPIMHIHGTGDDVVKWEGDPNHAAGGYGRIDDYVKKWAAYEGCDTEHPQVIRPYPKNNTSVPATRTRYTGADGVEVTLIAIDGKGHWHSNEPNGVHSTRELWNFFQQYRLSLPDDEDEKEADGDIVFQDGWEDEVVNVGEGIPTGWTRVNSSADGSKDEKAGGTANCGGARLKDFIAGGDFNTGFYLSARNFDECKLSYGQVDGYRLHLAPGKYQLSFSSVFWSEGAMNAAATYDVSMVGLSDSQPLLNAPGMDSSGCMKENNNQVVGNAAHHFLSFTVAQEGDYVLSFTMNQGWNSVIIGNVKVRKTDTTGTERPGADAVATSRAEWYDISGRKARNNASGILIQRQVYADGTSVATKVLRQELP